MRIAELFGQDAPVISFEFFPPKNEQAEAGLARALEKLRLLEPSFVSVTYGAGGSTRDKTVELVCRIKRDLGIETMAHLTCVAATREELGSVLDQLREGGIDNVLALRGDPPQGEEKFVTTAGGFQFASELTSFVRENYSFCLGGACYPEGHVECRDLDQDLRHLKKKVEAGSDFLVTQLFFDPEVYFRFVDRARSVGITCPIVPGIMPITNVDQVERFTAMCGASIPEGLHRRLEAVRDDRDEVRRIGIEHATDQCAALLQEGAPGIHFYTLNRSPATRAIFEELRRRDLV